MPVHHFLRSQDQDWGEPGRVDRHIRFLAENMRRTMERVGEAAGIRITEEMLGQGRALGREHSRPKRRIMGLALNVDPPPVSGVLLHLIRGLSGTALSLRGMTWIQGTDLVYTRRYSCSVQSHLLSNGRTRPRIEGRTDL